MWSRSEELDLWSVIVEDMEAFVRGARDLFSIEGARLVASRCRREGGNWRRSPKVGGSGVAGAVDEASEMALALGGIDHQRRGADQ